MDRYCMTHDGTRFKDSDVACGDFTWMSELHPRGCVPAELVRVGVREAEQSAIGFLDEFLNIGGNGEGWTGEDFHAAVDLLLRRPLTLSQRARMLSILGEQAVNALAGDG